MKVRRWISRIIPVLLAVLGLCTAILGVWLGLTSINEEPVLVERPAAAREQLVSMLDSLCDGDYESAGKRMLGTPSLGVDRSAADETGALLWDAFVDSISYELVGECYATNTGLAQDVKFTTLDFDSVTGTLRERTQDILQQRLEDAEDVSQIYDENNNFREDVVMYALLDAMKDAIAQDAAYEMAQITVNLVFEEDRWWIVPDDALLNVISGGILN